MQKRILSTLLLGTLLAMSGCSDDSPAQNSDPIADVIEDSYSDDVCANCEPPDADAADGDGAADGDDEDSLNLIVAHDQVVAPAESNQVRIAAARVQADGFVVVYAECTNCLVPGPGEIVGSQAVAAGEHADVAVIVDHNLQNNQTYYALLHDDVNADGVLDYAVGTGGEDVSLKENNEPIMDAFLVNGTSVIATDQTLSNLSTLVTLSEVYSHGAGWAVIREGVCADEGTVVGFGAMADGASVNTQVTLQRPAQDAETLCATLHQESGQVGNFEFDPTNAATPDAPVQLADDSLVRAEFVVTVPEGLPALRFTLSNPEGLGYIVDSVEPSYYGAGLSEAVNPFFGLRAGWRYEFVNQAAAAHPFEFIRKGITSGALEQPDGVILSQAVVGSGEADADIDWVEDANKFRFTVTGEPWTSVGSIDGYRSASAPAQVRGDIGVYVQ